MRNIALCYVRRSVVKTAADEVSPERQRARCIAEAERRGFSAEIYEDAEGHRSGRSERGRPGWLALKAQLDRPEIAALIVESLSRASRSVKDLANLIEELQARGIALVSLKENVDTQTAMGRAFVGFIAVMNQFESDIASERMTANIAYKRTAKGRHWGLTPFGCARAGPDCTLVPTQEGVTTDGVWRGYHEALQRCYEWYAEGETGIQRLADRLNAAGYRFRDRHGKPRLFNKDDVRRILDAHRIYAGFVPLGRAKDHPDEIRKGNHRPILSVELCDAVANVLAARHVDRVCARDTRRVYLLSDVLFCARCGEKLVGSFQKGDQWYRHDGALRGCSCKGQVKAALLDAQAMDRLSQFALPEQLKERIRFLARKMAAESSTPDWAEARALLRRLERKAETLKEMRLEGEVGKEEYQRRKREIEAEMHQAQERLQHAPADVKDIEGLLPKVDEMAAIIRAGRPEHKKRLFNALFERIEQRDGQLTTLVPRAWARPFFNGGNGVRGGGDA